MPTDIPAADLARWAAECERLRDQLATMTQAVGLAATIKGAMVMRADDPIGMMQEVAEYVSSLAERLAFSQEIETALTADVGAMATLLDRAGVPVNPGDDKPAPVVERVKWLAERLAAVEQERDAMERRARAFHAGAGALQAEIERLTAERAAHADAADRYIRERDALRDELRKLASLVSHVASRYL